MAAFVGTALTFVGITFAAGAPSPLFVLYQHEWDFPDWVLTIAFAIYAITLLVTLLVAGSLSDHIGRRPVLIGALTIQLASMIVFLVAPNIGWIIIARAIQGIATGAATGTFTATIVELAPDHRKKLGALIASTAPIGGLALGAFITGAAVQFTTQPTVLIFSALAVVFGLGIAVVAFAPETVTRRRGAVRSLIPRLSVPRPARREFGGIVPLLIATWMLGGLFLGLAPSIIGGVFHVESGFLNGAIVALLPATSSVAGFFLGRLTPRLTMLAGAPAVAIGIAVIVAGIVWGILPLLFVGAIVGGVGFGAAFSGSLRIMSPLADSHQRAELFAAIYLVSYLAYGVPALVAGQLIGRIGLVQTVVIYGGTAILAAVAGLITQLRLARVGAVPSKVTKNASDQIPCPGCPAAPGSLA
jgi:MFS family permease